MKCILVILIGLISLSIQHTVTRTKRQPSNYQETTAPSHGRDGGALFTVICPHNGVITGIDVRSGWRIDQITFTCRSSEGKTTLGPYGGGGGSEGSSHCPDGSYISSIYGRSGYTVDKLGIRCRKVDDMTSQGEVTNQPFGGDGGSSFDDVSYSIGFRPVAIKLRGGALIDSIQVTYGNMPVKFCQDCSNYQEEWAPVHGGGGGTLHSFICPNEGVITGIDLRYGYKVDQIKFTCTSSIGKTTFGPYGGGGGGTASDHCPTGYYIGSIHGRSGSVLDKLGIRCVKSSQPTGLNRDAWGGNGGGEFDDQLYNRNYKRPVEIRVRAGEFVDSIQIKYGKMPVALECQTTKIEVIDQGIVAKHDGLETIGVKSGFSCAPGTSQLILTATQTKDETTGVDVTEGGDINWSTTVGIAYTYTTEATVGVASVSSSISLSLSQSVGGSRSWSNTKTTSMSIGSQNQQGVQYPFEGPGASLAVGYLNRYKIERDNVPVLFQLTCAEGIVPSKPGKIKLSSNTFADAKSQNFVFKFNSTEKCTDEARMCVNSLRVGSTFSDPLNLRKQFNACFPSGSGIAY